MKRGFTLIEIAVVVAIMIVLSSIFVANYREGERQFALQRSAHKLAQDLRRVQEMAMAGQQFEETFPKGGYGIHFKEDSGSYFLFADCNGNGEFDETGAAVSCQSATPEKAFPEMIEEIFLEEKIVISNLAPVTGGNTLAITFFPPDPIVTITPAASSGIIELSFNGTSQSVIVNLVGLIDIQ